jgi:hypothetical protein
MMLEVPVKKLIGAIASLAATVVLASPVNNPASTAQFEAGLFTGAQQDYTVRIGLVSNSVNDRKYEVKSSKSHVDQASFRETSLALTVGMFNRFDLYARLGTASLDTIQRNTGNNIEIHTAPGVRWAVGGSAILYSMDNTTVNAFGEYSRFKADVNSVTVGATSSGFTAAKARAHDWNFGVGLAHTIIVSPDMCVVPNLAVRYSDGKARFTNETITSPSTTLPRLEARSHFGATIGCGLYAGKIFGVNVNANFFDETAVGVSAEIRI